MLRAEKGIWFKGLRITGFCAISGTLNYKLNTPGLNIIRGKNGIGKTTIFSALIWALYGDLLKKTKGVVTWEDMQPKDYKGTKVEIDFTVGDITFTVIRCFKYKGTIEGMQGASRLMIYQDGVYNTELRDKKDVQAYILEILGYSSSLFKNSILFGQKLTRLIGESGPRKKELFEEAFEVSWVGEAKAKAKKHHDEAKEDLMTLQEKEMALEDSIQEIDSNIEELNENQNSWLKNRMAESKDIEESINLLIKGSTVEYPKVTQEDVEKVRAKRDKLHKMLHKYNADKAALRILNSSYDSLGRDITATRMDITKKQNEIKNLPTNCNKCGSPLNNKERSKTIDSLEIEIDALKVELKAIEEEAAEHDRDMKKLQSRIGASSTTSNKLRDIEKEIDKTISAKAEYERAKDKDKNRDKEIDKLEAELKKLKKKESPYESLISTQSEKLEKAQKNYRKIAKRTLSCRKKFEAFKWVLDDPLSNKGIKAYIFSTMIEYINDALEKYQPTLGFFINFGINLETARKDFETSIYQGDNIREYEELSGGQQQLVDVAIAFAMHDVMSVGKPSNILLMDEVFESLDDENIEKVIELIRVKADKLAVHLVTHRKDFKVTNARELEITSKGILTL